MLNFHNTHYDLLNYFVSLNVKFLPKNFIQRSMIIHTEVSKNLNTDVLGALIFKINLACLSGEGGEEGCTVGR